MRRHSVLGAVSARAVTVPALLAFIQRTIERPGVNQGRTGSDFWLAGRCWIDGLSLTAGAALLVGWRPLGLPATVSRAARGWCDHHLASMLCYPAPACSQISESALTCWF